MSAETKSSGSGASALRAAFKVGKDRLYGLKGERDPVQRQIELQHQLTVDQSTVTIDRINNRLGLAGPDLFHRGWNPADHKSDGLHATDDAFAKFLGTLEGVRGKRLADRGQNQRIRRAAKLGIDFTRSQGGTVHFMLDDIDMGAVAGKKNYQPEPGKDITASELRYVRRNWDGLKASVKFYRDEQAVDAPWVSDAKAWGAYQPGAKKKHSWMDAGGSGPGTPRSEASTPLPDVQAQAPVVRRATIAAQAPKPAWNPSTRIDRPLSETATKLTVWQPPASVSGKVGSKSWPG